MSFPIQGSNCNVQTGPDIEDIQTEAIGFLAVSGESKVQVLPNPWPNEDLPPPTSSLLAVASKNGIVAAAGPEAIVLASTESLRKAFNGPETGKVHLKCVESLLILPMSFRISQVAFSADEKYLILSAEIGGGLAVYDVLALMSGSQQTAFELPTNGCALRAIAPNPTPEKGEYLAIVTMNGNLMIANLLERKFISGPEGFVLKQCVSCISWSSRGKQLVAGLGDGTAYQMTPDGEGKSVIPRPPNVGQNDFEVSSILWLENHMFLLVHSQSSPDPSVAPSSLLHLATRTSDCQNYTFQKVSDPAQPFGLNRSPTHHFTIRLRNFPPNLQDLIIMASTTSTDIGLLTRSKVPLTNEKPAEKVTGVLTITELLDDSRRAQLPLSITSGDTSPIGVGLDLSSRENVSMPIPGDEITESAYPIPALMILNNEGVLSSWWIIYSDSVRERTIYPGLVVAAKQDAKTTTPVNNLPSAAMEIAASSQKFGSPNTLPFGTVRSTGIFGIPSQPGSNCVFGDPSSLGRQVPNWGIPSNPNNFSNTNSSFADAAFSLNSKAHSLKPAFGVPEFGKASTPNLGIGTSLWGKPLDTTSKSTFGKADGENNEKESTQSPFAAYISNPGFLGASKSSSIDQKPFESKLLMGGSISSQVPSQVNEPVGVPIFGLSSSEKFVVGSTFKADPIEKNQSEDSNSDRSNIFFDSFVGDLPNTATHQVAAPAVPEEIQDKSKGISEYQNMPLTDETVTNNILSTPRTPLFSSSNDSKTTDISSASVKTSMAMSLPTDLGPKNPSDNKSSGATSSRQRKTSITGKQDLLPNSTGNKIIVPEAPLPPYPTIKDSPSIRKSAQTIPIPESPCTPEVTSKSQSDPRHSNHYNTSPSNKNRDTIDNHDVLSLEYGHEQMPSSKFKIKEERVPHDQIFYDRTQKNICDIEEHPAQAPEIYDTTEGQVTVEQSSSTDVPSGPEDDGISLSDDGKGDNEDEDDDDDDDNSQAGTDDFREEENQGEISTNSILDAEGNQLAGLSPESSYDIVEHSLLENSELVKSSKSVHNAQSKTSFSEVKQTTDKGKECPSSPSLIQKSNDSNSVPFESHKASSTIDGVLQSSAPKNEECDRREILIGTRLIGKERGEKISQIDFETQMKSEEEKYNEILACKEKEKKLQAELMAQVEAEEKRRNRIIAERKAEEKRHHELVLQREAEERRRNQIIAQTKAEEKRRNELIAQWEAEEKRHEELKAQKEAMEKQALVDEDDMYMQSYLASDIDRTTILNDFVAHSDYVSTTSGDNIPAQVETVYRDINSMIDTLGLNARSLKEFMLGHSEEFKREERNRDDLNDDSNWVLGEIKALSNVVEKDLTQELERGQLQDFEEKIETIKELQNDLRKLRSKHFDIKKIVATSQDPDHIAMARAQPLGAKEVAQQQVLRREFMKFQRLLSEAEEALAILKAKIVSQSASHGRPGSSSGLTVEAIMRTITKLTSMAEKKSGDIDVLEGQIRRLKLHPPATSMGCQESLLTPLKRGSSYRNSVSNIYGLYTPERAKCSPFQNSLISSTNSFNQISPPRRKLSGYSTEEKVQLRLKLDRKKEVLNKLKSNLENIGVTVSIMDSFE